MSILTCPYPGNINPLLLSQYQFSIAKLPSLTYFVQETEIPEMSLGSSLQASSVHDIKLPGDTLEFADITVQFIIDEELNNWNAIFFWMQALGFPESNQQFTNFINAQVNSNTYSVLSKMVSDGTLTILDNTNNPKQIFTFVDMFPISLSGLRFSSQTTDKDPAIGTATFAYSYYKINKSPPT